MKKEKPQKPKCVLCKERIKGAGYLLRGKGFVCEQCMDDIMDEEEGEEEGI
mgnify:CR=1 FL=1